MAADCEYLLDSLYHRLQPVDVDLAVAVQEGQDGGRGRVGAAHARSDQTWAKSTGEKAKKNGQIPTMLLERLMILRCCRWTDGTKLERNVSLFKTLRAALTCRSSFVSQTDDSAVSELCVI